jgi:hypothetical protein
MSDGKIPLQDYFNAVARSGFEATLLTFDEAAAKNSWMMDVAPPRCCGQPINIDKDHGYLECETCHKFAHDVTFSLRYSYLGAIVDVVNVDTPVKWIAGVRPAGA